VRATQRHEANVPQADDPDTTVNLSAALNRTLTMRYGDEANFRGRVSVSLRVGIQGVNVMNRLEWNFSSTAELVTGVLLLTVLVGVFLV
jgi:hypothetical protein